MSRNINNTAQKAGRGASAVAGAASGNIAGRLMGK